MTTVHFTTHNYHLSLTGSRVIAAHKRYIYLGGPGVSHPPSFITA